MTTVNLETISISNRRLGQVINDLGELLMRENIDLYKQIILEYSWNRTGSEKSYLIGLYELIISKLSILGQKI